ncbi:unnamed protein product, partial [Allacma fusca]
ILMATGDTSSKGNQHAQDLIERAADQMAQLDLVGKTLSSNASEVANASAAKTTNGTETKMQWAAEGKKSSAKPASSTPGSGRTSRKPSTSNTTSKKVPEKPPEEQVKKLPMNKIKVGNAASPNVKQVTSKIGSLSIAGSYKPSGGNVRIESKKLNWKAESKIGSLGNVTHVPGGGAVKIETKKVELKNVQSRIGSLGNVKHKPGGGEKKIFDDKEYLKRCSSNNSTGRGSKTPSEGVCSPKGSMSPTPLSPAPEMNNGNV